MRIALLADIHGNDLALQAVLDDIERNGSVDEFWVLGDLVAIGPAPIKVLETLNDLPNTSFVRGNTDRYVCTSDRPPPSDEDVMADTDLLGQRIEVEGDFCWTQGAVTTAGWFEWLAKLPVEIHCRLPDGTEVLCVHASPKNDDGTGFQANMTNSELMSQLSDCKEDLVCVGHTHRPFNISVHGKRIINPGSVSNPVVSGGSACYAILDADEDGYDVEFYRVSYDHQIIIDLLEQIKHPARRFITRHFRNGDIAEPERLHWIRAQCIVHKENKLLMVKHHGNDDAWWCLPGGGVEPGETPAEAAIRELREECGVDGTIIREINKNNEAYTFLVDIKDQNPRLGIDPEFQDSDSVLVDLAWMTLAQIPERDRTFLWDAGLLRIPVFLTEVSGWGDDLSYPGSGL